MTEEEKAQSRRLEALALAVELMKYRNQSHWADPNTVIITADKFDAYLLEGSV